MFVPTPSLSNVVCHPNVLLPVMFHETNIQPILTWSRTFTAFFEEAFPAFICKFFVVLATMRTWRTFLVLCICTLVSYAENSVLPNLNEARENVRVFGSSPR